jgi:glycosyltransferase involved in cell wall biosynthesis
MMREIQSEISSARLLGHAALPRPLMVLSADAIEGQGGQGLNLQHMIEGLRADFDLTVFCRAATRARCHPVPPSRLARTWQRIPVLRRARDWSNFVAEREFDRYVAAHLPKADLFQGATGQCAESLDAARKVGCRTAVDVVTTHIDDFIAQQERECRKFGIRPATSSAMRRRMLDEYQRADLIRVMSDYARRTFLERGFAPERVIAVRPHLDITEFPEAAFDDATFRVAYVGLIEPWKGFHYLIEAYSKLALENSELIFWGGTASRSIARYMAEAQARNRSISIRPVAVRDVGLGEVYGKASVVVHPSLADGFSYVVAEAMACGVPVIVTPTTGAAELIRDGHNGYLVPPADSGAIAERIEHLAHHRELVRPMGVRARQTVAEELTLDDLRRRSVPRLNALMA